MKKINKAYADNNLEALCAIDDGQLVGSLDIKTIEELKIQL
jgi:hypothetical protein